jgi:hypothetical protein
VLLKSHTAMSDRKISKEQYAEISDAFTDAVCRIIVDEVNGDSRIDILERSEGVKFAGMLTAEQYKEISKSYKASIGLAS